MNSDKVTEMRDKINSVSSCFCLAKWLQVTVDLVHGTTHSCHHPRRHRIPREEVLKNPSALHNTEYKKEQRRMMLEGKRPPECVYCWESEDAGVLYSDRIIKSSDSWALPELERIRTMPWNENVHPTFLEVMLDNLCNFSCVYCMADISTGVAAEIKRFGGYDLSPSTQGHRKPYESLALENQTDEEKNIYREAFWKWLPEILPSLKMLRITGGEPLISPHFQRVIEYVLQHPSPQLQFAVNSHLSHGPKIIDEFIANIQTLRANNAIGGLEIYTSVDTFGPAAEFIRPGLNYERWLNNLRYISTKLDNPRLIIMCTFNILSVAHFPQLIDDLVELKKHNPNLLLDISSLRDPGYLRADLADDELLEKIKALPTYMAQFSNSFTEHEIKKMENVATWSASKSQLEHVETYRRDLSKFIFEFGRRKGKDPLELFPDYKNFFAFCKDVGSDGLLKNLFS